MPVALTRTIQIGALLIAVVSLLLMVSYFQEADMATARSAAMSFGCSIIIFLLTTIIRLITDLGEAFIERVKEPASDVNLQTAAAQKKL